MEYEIPEEGELLDDTNNPSLDHAAKPSSVTRKMQQAELIPGESKDA